MPVETAKCWWLLKIEPNAWAGGKGSCAVCVDLQAVGALEFFGELYSLAEGFGPFLRGFGHATPHNYAELHALSPLRGSISPCYEHYRSTCNLLLESALHDKTASRGMMHGKPSLDDLVHDPMIWPHFFRFLL